MEGTELAEPQPMRPTGSGKRLEQANDLEPDLTLCSEGPPQKKAHIAQEDAKASLPNASQPPHQPSAERYVSVKESTSKVQNEVASESSYKTELSDICKVLNDMYLWDFTPIKRANGTVPERSELFSKVAETLSKEQICVLRHDASRFTASKLYDLAHGQLMDLSKQGYEIHHDIDTGKVRKEPLSFYVSLQAQKLIKLLKNRQTDLRRTISSHPMADEFEHRPHVMDFTYEMRTKVCIICAD
jgi:hypothetical protein